MNWYKKSENKWKRHYKTLNDGVEVFLVDGEYVRDQLSIEFALGGHHYVKKYANFIPENEIWIEPTEHERDLNDNLCHEIHERTLMKEDGLSYDEAHEKSSLFERNKREEEKREE